MPTKPFYSLDEVCQKLRKTPDQVKALVREGTLREFRDAGKIFFKSDDIEKLVGAAASADSGEILLEPAAEPPARGVGEPSLADSSSGTSIIGLEPLPEEEEKEDTVITAGGVGVLDEDEVESDTDPMAKTQITAQASDQISLEGAGSGSGLLDLAREADDTALGADLLDEIYPGEDQAAEEEKSAAPVAAERAAAVEEEPALEEAEAGEVVMPVVVPMGDTSEGLFSGLLVASLLVMAVATTVVAGVVQGYVPDFGRFLADGGKFFIFLAAAIVVSGLAAVGGWFLTRAFAGRRR